MKKVWLIALTLAVPAVAFAAPENGSAPADPPKKEKKICRSEDVTGSLTRVNRVCMTQREWDELATQTGRSMNNLGRRPGEGSAMGASSGL